MTKHGAAADSVLKCRELVWGADARPADPVRHTESLSTHCNESRRRGMEGTVKNAPA